VKYTRAECIEMWPDGRIAQHVRRNGLIVEVPVYVEVPGETVYIKKARHREITGAPEPTPTPPKVKNLQAQREHMLYTIARENLKRQGITEPMEIEIHHEVRRISNTTTGEQL
jgi:hypothetical protein